MTNNHLDQLAQWWENAERGAPSKGDAIIRRTERLLSNGYAYEVGTEDYTDAKHLDNVRILARAPKPKPAWHDAIAVTATATDDLGDEITAVWVREGDELWRSDEGGTVLRDDLRDVTPLIEAKVTDEQARKALVHYYGDSPGGTGWHDDIVTQMRLAIGAALGLDTE